MSNYGIGKRRFDPLTLIGLLLTALLHGGGIAGVLLYRKAHATADLKPPGPASFVVAQLVRLGKPPDPKKLPDKAVPQQETRKDEGIDLTPDADAKPNLKKPRRHVPLADRLRNALDRASALDPDAKARLGEGDPRGVRGGTARNAKAGDAWMTRVADLYIRTWSLPSIISQSEARKLYVLLVLRIDRNGTIQFPLAFDRRSGNEHFDTSVVSAWQQIRRLPLPPSDRLASVLANGLALRLTYKGLQ